MYENLEPQQIFQAILDEKISRFPNGYWKQPGIENECAIITKYFIEHVLKWDDDEVKEKMNERIFREYKLSGMLEYVFDRSYFKAIDNTYPNKYKAWEFKCVPRGYWTNNDNVLSAISYLLERTGKNKFNELTNADFFKNKLGGLMDFIYKSNIYDALELEFVEKNLVLGNIIQNISFAENSTKSKRNSLRARLEIPISLLDAIGINKSDNKVVLSVEGEYIVVKKLEQLPEKTDQIIVFESVLNGKNLRFPKHYWEGEKGKINALIIIRYLIDEILKWNEQDVIERMSMDIFKKYKLDVMLLYNFGRDYCKAIDNAYSCGKYKDLKFKHYFFIFKKLISNEIKKSTVDIWNELSREEIVYMLRYFFEEHLKWNLEDIKNNCTLQTFKDYNLYGLLALFKMRVFNIIEYTYPNKIKPWEMKKTTRGYWNKNTKVEVLKEICITEKINRKNYTFNNLMDALKKYEVTTIYKDMLSNDLRAEEIRSIINSLPVE